VYPDHTTKFTGTTIWRTLVPLSKVAHLPDVNTTTTWWYGKVGHVYTSPVDDASEFSDDKRTLEISCRNLVDPATDTRKRFSWGVPATNERVLSHFTVSTDQNVTKKGRAEMLCRITARKFGTLCPKRQRALGRSSLLSPAQDCKSSQLGTSVCYSAMPATHCQVSSRVSPQ
jgi:hypothetical protein